MTPKKRSMDEVFAAIGAAMAETQGRILGQVDPAGDAAIVAARRQVSVTLQDYQPFAGADSGDAERRYRQELERALHGPLAVPGALRAWMLSVESEEGVITAEERVLAHAWVAATQRARVEGMKGLADSPTAWFEVRPVRIPPAPAPARQPVATTSACAGKPQQPDLF